MAFVELANTSVGLLDHKLTSVGQWLGGLKLSDSLINGIRLGERGFNSWRVRVLHQTARRCIRTPDVVIAGEVERIFGRPLSLEDHARINRW